MNIENILGIVVCESIDVESELASTSPLIWSGGSKLLALLKRLLHQAKICLNEEASISEFDTHLVETLKNMRHSKELFVRLHWRPKHSLQWVSARFAVVLAHFDDLNVF